MKLFNIEIRSPFRVSASATDGVSSFKRYFMPLSFGSGANIAKEIVTPDTSMSLSAYYAAIRNISEDIAKQPIEVIETQEDGDIIVLDKNPVQRLLKIQPNPEMTPMTMIETLTAHALGWGNGYSWIQRDYLGYPIALFPIHPARVIVQRDDSNTVVYHVYKEGNFNIPGMKSKGSYEVIQAKDMLHIKGLGGDGLVGYSVAHYANEAFGAAIAAQKFSSAYFGNGTWVGGFVEHPQTLSPEAHLRIKESLNNDHQGAGNAHKIKILEEGMKWTSTTVNPRDSQLVELRKFHVVEIARWFRMPPTKIGDFERATFSNVEHTNIDYNTDTLTPWATRWEQELKIKLFLEEDQISLRFNESALLRGDAKTRAEVSKMYWDIGVKSPNEIRKSEGLNAYEGGGERYRPLNYAVIGAEEVESADPEPMIDDAIARVDRKEQKAMENKNLNIAEFYKKQEEYLGEALKPIFKAFKKEMSLELKAIICAHYVERYRKFSSGEKIVFDNTLKNEIMKACI